MGEKRRHRIAALQCNFQTREQTLGMVKKWKAIGFDTEQLFHTHADCYSAVYDAAKHEELLTEYIANAKKENLEIIVYMNAHIMGPTIAHMKEEWGVHDPVTNKNLMLYDDVYPGCCMNSPWREFLKERLAELKKYEIRGIFFDGPLYRKCGCKHCRAKFEKMFNKSFDQATDKERQKLMIETMIEFKKDMYDTVKKINPSWISYFNEPLYLTRESAEDTRRSIASSDIVGTEGGFFFGLYTQSVPYWKCSFAAKLAEAVADGKETVIFFAGDRKPWCWTLHTPVESTLCYELAAANGASVWYGLHCNPSGLDGRTGVAIHDILTFDRAHAGLYDNTRSLANLAVFYSFDTGFQMTSSGESSDFYGADGIKSKRRGDYLISYQGAVAVLEHSNLSYDMLTDVNLEDIGRYKAVLVPSLTYISEKTRAAFRAYMENGGILIADGEFAQFDEKGKQLSCETLCEFAGFSYTGKVYEDFMCNYFTTDPALYTPDSGFGLLPTGGWSLEIKPAADTKVIARADDVPLKGGYAGQPRLPFHNPFGIEKSVGRGKLYYFATNFYELYRQHVPGYFPELVRAIFKENNFTPPVLVKSESPSVSVVLRECADGSLALHLVNFTSAFRPIEKIVPVYNTEVTLPEKFKFAKACRANMDLKQTASGSFIVPEIREFELIHFTVDRA